MTKPWPRREGDAQSSCKQTQSCLWPSQYHASTVLQSGTAEPLLYCRRSLRTSCTCLRCSLWHPSNGCTSSGHVNWQSYTTIACTRCGGGTWHPLQLSWLLLLFALSSPSCCCCWCCLLCQAPALLLLLVLCAPSSPCLAAVPLLKVLLECLVVVVNAVQCCCHCVNSRLAHSALLCTSQHFWRCSSITAGRTAVQQHAVHQHSSTPVSSTTVMRCTSSTGTTARHCGTMARLGAFWHLVCFAWWFVPCQVLPSWADVRLVAGSKAIALQPLHPHPPAVRLSSTLLS